MVGVPFYEDYDIEVVDDSDGSMSADNSTCFAPGFLVKIQFFILLATILIYF